MIHDQNYKLHIAAINLIKKTAIIHNYLKEVFEDDPKSKYKPEWTFSFRCYLMESLLDRGYAVEVNEKIRWIVGQNEMIAELLTYHKNYNTDQRLRNIVAEIERQQDIEPDDFSEQTLDFALACAHDIFYSDNVSSWDYGDTAYSLH